MALTTLNSKRDFFRVWFSWKRQALYAFLLIFVLVTGFSYLYTPDYVSNAKILLLPRTSEGAVISTGNIDESRIAPISLEDINTEIELLTSTEVLQETVRSFAQKTGGGGGMGLKKPSQGWVDRISDTVKKALNDLLVALALKERLSPFDANVKLLGNSLEIEPVANSNILLVSLTAEIPKAATVVLNRLLEIYERHHSRIFSKEQGISFYEAQAEDYRQRLGGAEANLKEHERQWNIVSLTRQKEADIASLADLSRELRQMELGRDEMENRIALLRKDLEENKHDTLITKEMREIPSIIEMEKSLTPLLIQRSQIAANYTQSSKIYQEIEAQLAAIRESIRQEIRWAIDTEVLEASVMKNKEASLRNKIAALQADTNVLNQREKTLAALQREVDLLQKDYVLYAAKTEDARINQERSRQNLSNISIAQRATFPVEPDFPNRVLMLIVSLVVGLFGALGTPFILEFLDRRFKIAEDVAHVLDLPVICAFPETEEGIKR